MKRVRGDGVELALVDEGEGPAVLLLHGFPDSSHLWRHQVPALVEAGFRVLAPDLRGFGESDRPDEVEEYAITRSLADVVAILDGLGVERAHVVGHDYGAALAWVLAGLAPERVDRLAVLSVGHPNTLRHPSVAQREKFWYQLLFLFEGTAEELLTRDDWALLREFSARRRRPGAVVRRPVPAGRADRGAQLVPGERTCRRASSRSRPFPAIGAPTLGLWSSGDNYLLEEGMLASGEHVTGSWRYERIEGASHWLQLDAPERVNELLLEFLA